MRPQFAIVWPSFQDIAQKNDSMTRFARRADQARAVSADFATPGRALPYNPAMRHLDFLLPFSLPSPDLAADLLRALRLPSFALLAARAKSGRLQVTDGFARALPHEAWLAERFSLQAGLAQGGSPPVAPAAMAAHGLEAGQGRWFMLQPAHLHVARDHLVLTDPRQLALEERESRALFDSAQALLADVGVPLLYGDTRTWFLRAGDWRGLQTSTGTQPAATTSTSGCRKGRRTRLAQAAKRDPDGMACAPGQRSPRRARRQAGQLGLAMGRRRKRHRRAGFRLQPCVRPARLGRRAGRRRAGILCRGRRGKRDRRRARPGPADDRHPERAGAAGDWSLWLDAWHALEADWLAPLLAALQSGKLDS